MQELIRRSMTLWQRARRAEASRDEIARCLAVVPELCGELEECRDRRARRRSAVEWVQRDDVERLGRHFGHEIRNRLNIVELSIERASLLSGDSRVRSALDPVRRSFQHLEAMAEDLRCAAAPRPTAYGGGVPLRTVIDDLISTYRVLAEERGVRLEADGEVPDVEVDAARLELILANLLSNALRHPDPGKSSRWVRIQACTAGDDGGDAHDGRHSSLRCAVVDNGLGIPADRLPNLFEEPPPDDDGTPARRGLGLVIVRQAVERSGGRVWVESRESEGTGVYFTCTATGVAGRSARPATPVRSATVARGGH